MPLKKDNNNPSRRLSAILDPKSLIGKEEEIRDQAESEIEKNLDQHTRLMSRKSLAVPSLPITHEDELGTDELTEALIRFKESSKSQRKKDKKVLMSPKSVTQRV